MNPTYIWNGSGITASDGSFTLSQFFSDNNGNFYYYDQNYNGLFPIQISNGIPTYTDTSYAPVLVAPNIALNPQPQYQSYLLSIYGQILNGRFNQYQSNPVNALTTFTQNPSTLVGNTLSQAVSGTSISNAVNQNANILTNLPVNFILNDIIGSWQNGSGVAKQMLGFLSLFQGYLAQDLGKIQAISDFKKKLLNIQTQVANGIGATKGQVDAFAQTGTFNQLASAMPSTFGGISQIFTNLNGTINKELAQILPSTGLPPSLQAEINVEINSLFGGLIKPLIANTADKILLDLNQIQQIFILHLSAADWLILNLALRYPARYFI